MNKKNTKNPVVSIIILNWNELRFLKNCFTSLEKQRCKDFETIFIDNASLDSEETIRLVKREYPQFRIIQNKKNLGYAAANNAGVEQAQGEYLLFLNADTKLDPDCLLELLHSARRNKKVGIWTCRQLSYQGDFKLNDGSAYDLLGTPCVGKIFYADGASLFISSALFKRLGGFDATYFLVAEDIDLCWRARLLGYDIKCNTKAIVYHESGGSFIGGAKKGQHYFTSIWRRYLGERNNFRNLLKNYSLFMLFLIIPLYLLVNIAEIVLFTIIGRWNVARGAYLKAWGYNLTHLGPTLRKRREVQKMRKVSDWRILKKMAWKFGKLDGFLRTGLPRFK